ncbi:MAG: ABC transporter ATP-binding protein [Muribaculaceae bacterium]|nr:ABC transporter ATP-binding protein [Muribaculaceae bacterium]
MQASISTRALSAGYADRELLSGVDIELYPGQMAVLIGANGSGKSTLLRTLAGSQKPLAGSVNIEGCNPSSGSRRELARHLAVVTTARHGGGALTVEECAAIGRNIHTGFMGRLSPADKSIVHESLAAVGMAEKARRYIGTLSDGERQKVMIARALAQECPVLILDEPTAFLDVAGRLEIMRLLRRLADRGRTVLLSTHDIAPAIACADVLMVVDAEQRSLYSGPREQIIAEGIIDRAFAASGLHFDSATGDFA